MAQRIQVVFDCKDPDAQAGFWAYALGYQLQPPPSGFASWEDFLRARGLTDRIGDASAIVDPDGHGPRVYFQRVPEPKVAKNRVHLDINVVGRAEITSAERRRTLTDAADDLVAHGATVIRPLDEIADEYFIVLQDPEGNEFCVQ
jgi:hypothetical protein